MNLAITIFDIAMMTLVSWVFLKKRTGCQRAF